MNNKTALFSLATVFAILFLVQGAYAVAPFISPTALLNNEAMQCARLHDTCISCKVSEVPEGWEEYWEQMRTEGPGGCPANYTEVNLSDVTSDYSCSESQTAFCCEEGHSDTYISCKNLVINRDAKQCAILHDNFRMVSPKWEKMPNATSWRDWLCPKGYDWQYDLDLDEKLTPAPMNLFKQIWSGILDWLDSLSPHPV